MSRSRSCCRVRQTVLQTIGDVEGNEACLSVDSPYTPGMTHSTRDVTVDDLNAVQQLNEAVTPAVNSLDLAELRWFLDNASYFRLVERDDGELLAFMIGLEQGRDYRSLNYQWFAKRHDRFAYVDRIAVANAGRRLGLASMLYDDFIDKVGHRSGLLVCEVNTKPRNDGSLAYHEALGFKPVGTQWTENNTKEVVLLERPLRGSENE